MRNQSVRRLLARTAVTATIAGLSAVALGTGAAYATGTTLYVGTTAGGNTGCADPGYTGVQAAVDAANPGDTVYLCGTVPFAGQVVVTKSITLTGDPGATIAPLVPWVASADALPPEFAADNLFAPQALVVVWGAGVDATISGLTVAGPLPGNGGCAEQEFGIVVLAGADAAISRDTVTNIRDTNASLYGCQYGVGILVGREYWPTSDFGDFDVEDFVGTATISNTTVSGYQKGGIVVDGPGSSATVRDDTVTGDGATGPVGVINAQNGVQVSRGATASVAHNTISDNQYSGLNWASATGVLIFGGCGDPLSTNVSVSANTLADNDIGVYVFNGDPTCMTPPATKTQNSVTNNTITDDAVTNVSGWSPSPLCGYQAGISEFGTHDSIVNNKISGVGYSPTGTCTVATNIDYTGATGTRLHNNK